MNDSDSTGQDRPLQYAILGCLASGTIGLACIMGGIMWMVAGWL